MLLYALRRLIYLVPVAFGVSLLVADELIAFTV